MAHFYEGLAMETRRRRHKKFPFRPSAAALLVLDVQNYFSDAKSHACVPSAPEIIPRINRLVKAFRAESRPVIFTRHIDAETDSLMNRWWQDSIREDDPRSLLNSELDVGSGKVVIKRRYDAFSGTPLEEMLAKSGVEQVAISGFVSHLCCETTARSAFMRNFETFFVTDATASYDPEHHKAAVLNLSHGFAVPMTTNDILKCFGGDY